MLILTGGHPFEADPFFSIFDDLQLDWTGAAQPDALELLGPDLTERFDVLVMYDMPGISFTGGDPPARFHQPSPEFQLSYKKLLETGIGMVFLHHAVASWPAWPEFAEIVGGRFHYQPGSLGGRDWPDSGYLFDVTHTVEVLEPEHPICQGLAPSFEITDELYLFPTLTEDVVPLMRSSHDFSDRNFYSADRAIRGERNSREGWSHPPGSDLVGWVKQAGNAPVAYIQFGDGPQTYEDENYRLVLANAVAWAASAEARSWAAARRADSSSG